MRLEDLVPPLELCRKIPKGDFEYSALTWNEGYVKGNFVIEQRGLGRYYICPAPTLQEILDEFGTEIDAKLYPHFLPPIWQFDVLFPDNTILHQSQVVVSNSGQNPAAFALKFYLRYLKEKERDSKNE